MSLFNIQPVLSRSSFFFSICCGQFCFVFSRVSDFKEFTCDMSQDAFSNWSPVVNPIMHGVQKIVIYWKVRQTKHTNSPNFGASCRYARMWSYAQFWALYHSRESLPISTSTKIGDDPVSHFQFSEKELPILQLQFSCVFWCFSGTMAFLGADGWKAGLSALQQKKVSEKTSKFVWLKNLFFPFF